MGLSAVRIPIIIATLLALLLGLISAGFAALIGPCFKVLMGGGQVYSWPEILGSPISETLGLNASLERQDLFTYLPVLLISASFIKSFLLSSQTLIWETSAEKVAKNLRRRLMRGFLELDHAQRLSQEGQKLESSWAVQLSNDIRLVRDYLVQFYGGIPRELLQSLFLLYLLWQLSPLLTAFFILGVAPAIWVLRILGRKLRHRTRNALSTYQDLSEHLQQRLFGLETIKHYGTEELEIKKTEAYTQELYAKFLKAEAVKARTAPLMEMLATTVLVAALGIALNEVYSGRLTGAMALSFFAALVLLIQSLSLFSRYYNKRNEGQVAWDRVKKSLEFCEKHPRKTLPLARIKQGSSWISCRRCSYRPTPSSAETVKDFSYEFLPGRVYVLVGPSGVGKTSLLKAILGLGKNVYYAPQLAAEDFLYVPQDVKLIEGISLACNIAYPEEPDVQRVQQSLKEVGLEGDDLSGDHVLGAGIEVSGGQAQRVLLARITYHSKKVLIIDEGSSALDPETERCVAKILRQAADAGALVIMSAHRQSALAWADEVVNIRGIS